MTEKQKNPPTVEDCLSIFRAWSELPPNWRTEDRAVNLKLLADCAVYFKEEISSKKRIYFPVKLATKLLKRQIKGKMFDLLSNEENNLNAMFWASVFLKHFQEICPYHTFLEFNREYWEEITRHPMVAHVFDEDAKHLFYQEVYLQTKGYYEELYRERLLDEGIKSTFNRNLEDMRFALNINEDGSPRIPFLSSETGLPSGETRSERDLDPVLADFTHIDEVLDQRIEKACMVILFAWQAVHKEKLPEGDRRLQILTDSVKNYLDLTKLITNFDERVIAKEVIDQDVNTVSLKNSPDEDNKVILGYRFWASVFLRSFEETLYQVRKAKTTAKPLEINWWKILNSNIMFLFDSTTKVYVKKMLYLETKLSQEDYIMDLFPEDSRAGRKMWEYNSIILDSLRKRLGVNEDGNPLGTPIEIPYEEETSMDDDDEWGWDDFK